MSYKTSSLTKKLNSNAHLSNRVMQRKCACGNRTQSTEKCEQCQSNEGVMQRKLTIGDSNDPLELEADRVADQVLSMPLNKNINSSPVKVQRLTPTNTNHSGTVPKSVENTLAMSGSPLSNDLQQNMGQRFGYDFSSVRVHNNESAARSARDVNANAYTVGTDIVFASGQYQPNTSSGKKLLAHELTHVVQQSATNANEGHETNDQTAITRTNKQLSRQSASDIMDEIERQAERIATERLNALAAEPGPAATFTHTGCPANFCQPFADRTRAMANLAWAGPLILAGIAKKVNSRVVPLWARYLAGGTAASNLSSDFGADFTASPTTSVATSFLVGAIRRDVETNHASLLGGATTKTVDFTPRLTTELTAIDTPGDPDSMNFTVIGDIAGNVAGGIGTDQLAFPIGAMPSPFNDSRNATVEADLVKLSNGDIEVTPTINFSIQDTIDLCPGNCGAATEQVATIPLSRFEATGLVGDVPFTIDFPAPASSLSTFTVTPPPPPPVFTTLAGETTASSLRIRSAPTTASAQIGSYPRGSSITILCETAGEVIDGNPTWYQTSAGYVSGRYVALLSSGTLAPC